MQKRVAEIQLGIYECVHKDFIRCSIDILTNLSYISKVVECPFNNIVDMKRYRYGVIENDANVTRAPYL